MCVCLSVRALTAGLGRVLAVVKASLFVNGIPRFLDAQGSNPQPIDIKLDRGDYVGDLTKHHKHADFGISTLKPLPLLLR